MFPVNIKVIENLCLCTWNSHISIVIWRWNFLLFLFDTILLGFVIFFVIIKQNLRGEKTNQWSMVK